MRVLGISAFYHDSAAALVCDGEIIAAAQEERFTRRKHDPGFPRHAVEYCLKEGGVGVGEVDLFAFYDKPLLKFERLLETYLAFAPRGFKSFSMAIPIWLREKLFLQDLLARELARLGCRPQIGRVAPGVLGASPVSCGERIFPVAIRRGGRIDDGWCRRVGNDVARPWKR